MKKLLYIFTFISIGINAQNKLGINTSEPTHELDVNGTMRVRNLATTQPYNSSDVLVWAENGVLKTTDKGKVFPTVPTQTGTLISDGNKVLVAQEFEVQMNGDQSFTSTTPSTISNLNIEILDNLQEIGFYGFQNGTFQVDESGYYSIFFNLQASLNKLFMQNISTSFQFILFKSNILIKFTIVFSLIYSNLVSISV